MERVKKKKGQEKKGGCHCNVGREGVWEGGQKSGSGVGENSPDSLLSTSCDCISLCVRARVWCVLVCVRL